MDINTIVLMILGLVCVIMNIIIINKQSEIMTQLRTPVVKKLSPEMKLKSHKKGFSNDSRQKNRNNKNTNNNDSERPNKRSNNGNKNSNRNTNPRRNTQPKHKHTTPTEIFSNETTEVKKTENVKTEAPKQREVKKPVQEKAKPETKASNSSARPSLAPRGESSVAPVAQEKTTQAPAVKVTENKAKEEKTIRHGRRTQVKKVPVLDDLD